MTLMVVRTAGSPERLGVLLSSGGILRVNSSHRCLPQRLTGRPKLETLRALLTESTGRSPVKGGEPKKIKLKLKERRGRGIIGISSLENDVFYFKWHCRLQVRSTNSLNKILSRPVICLICVNNKNTVYVRLKKHHLEGIIVSHKV